MTEKKTPTQKYIDTAVKQAVAASSKGTTIMNCDFVGAKYDAKSVDAITMIADGLVKNAISLGKLADVLKSSTVEIEAMVKIVEGKPNELS